jgi:hypothetical protein
LLRKESETRIGKIEEQLARLEKPKQDEIAALIKSASSFGIKPNSQQRDRILLND